MLGPGRYDKEAAEVREKLQAEAVLLVVFDREHSIDLTLDIAQVLRETAKLFEARSKKTSL